MNYQDPFDFLVFLSVIAGIGVLVSSLEMITIREHYQRGGLFSWEIKRVRSWGVGSGPLFHVVDALLRYPNVLVLISLQIVAVLLIGVFLESRRLFIIPISILTVTLVLMGASGKNGRNGADQMSTLIFSSLFLALLSDNVLVWKAELWFLALQLNLAYLTSGILKVRKKGWWDGSYLLLAIRTQLYGNEPVWRTFRKHPRLLSLMSKVVLLLECGFFITLLLPLRYSWPIFLAGILFHIANAVAMGLNTFVWSYLALYPAAAYCGNSAWNMVVTR